MIRNSSNINISDVPSFNKELMQLCSYTDLNIGWNIPYINDHLNNVDNDNFTIF